MNMKMKMAIDAIEKYEDYKRLFAQVADNCNKHLTNNQYLKAQITLASNGTEVNIVLMDKSFTLSFYITPNEKEYLGVIDTATPSPTGQPELLWRTYFDAYGNVKDTPDAISSTYNLREVEFLNVFIGEMIDKYFSNQQARLKKK